MICIDRKKFGKGVKQAVEHWTLLLEGFERQASSPYPAFILPHDDPRVQMRKVQALRQSVNDASDREVNWETCRGRHEAYRADWSLGFRRPLTQWVDNGNCKPPDYADASWYNKQVERVWDFQDMSLLRNALPRRGGFDSEFKMRIWEPSQNIDRFIDTQPFGIAPCITPTGIPYMTDRGGPPTGYDLLILQGLPIDKISFTSESDKQLQDLAGNAMSTTLVGAATLAALIVGIKVVCMPLNKAVWKPAKKIGSSQSTMEVRKLPEGILIGERALRKLFTESENYSTIDIAELLRSASLSSRLCYCEGQTSVTNKPIQKCQQCQHTTCVRCGGNPTHDYLVSPEKSEYRILPLEFKNRWVSQFPPIIRLKNLPNDQMWQKAWDNVTGSPIWQEYHQIVTEALDSELHLQQFLRSNQWIIYYDSPKARLALFMSDPPEWRFYAKSPLDLPGNSKLRLALNQPIARSVIRDHRVGILGSAWEIFIPHPIRVPILITGSDDKIASWRSRLGLTGHQHEVVPRVLNVTVKKDQLSLNISGYYRALPDCGTACGSLYKRVQVGEQFGESRDMYFFLDPTPVGDPDNDHFVFSHDHRRIGYNEIRDVIARIDSSWRPWDPQASKRLLGKVDGQWTDVQTPVKLEIIPASVTFHTHLESPRWDELITHCSQATTILECQFKTPSSQGKQWTTETIIGLDDKLFFSEFQWVINRASSIPKLQSWHILGEQALHTCTNCAPENPSIKWRVTEENNGRRVAIAQEDPTEACEYEKALKMRPSIFVIYASAIPGQLGRIKIGLNIRSLAHRAAMKLSRLGETVSVQWRLITSHNSSTTGSFPKFRFKDNSEDVPYCSPLSFLLPLREEQRRSLSWMIQQERPHVNPFSLKEVEEAILPQMGWRAEAQASANVYVRGGVLADQVSYGKTVTTLALIQSEFQNKTRDEIVKENNGPTPLPSGLINTAATLIVCSASLTLQWLDEIHKFLGENDYNKSSVLVVNTVADLKSMTITKFVDARIIIVQWDVFLRGTYITKLAEFAAMPEPTTYKGRAFDAWLDYATNRIPAHIQKLKNLGLAAFESELERLLSETKEDPDFQAVAPSKRVKGAAFTNQTSKPTSTGKSTTTKASKKYAATNKKATSKVDGWQSYQAPLFQLFRYNRLVVDEYTYLEGKNSSAYSSITRLKAEKRWVLSGTPARADFADIKRLALFLGVNLGADTETPGVITPHNLKRLQSDQTGVEKFLSFQDIKSMSWHEQRHQYAQDFLFHFARQNDAHLEDIDCKEILRPVELHPSHRAIYMELSQYLNSQDMNFKKRTGKSKSDRQQQIKGSLQGAETPEDALLRCALVIKSDSGFKQLLATREEQYLACYEELKEKIIGLEKLKATCGIVDTHYSKWKGGVAQNNTLGDEDAKQTLENIFKNAAKQARTIDVGSEIEVQEKAKILRKLLPGARVLSREFVTRRRGLRYIESIQRAREAARVSPSSLKKCHGPECPGTQSKASSLSVLALCGHIACDTCLENRKHDDRCVAKNCDVAIKSFHAVKASDLGADEKEVANHNRGKKLNAMVKLLTRIPEDEQAIIFVQNYQTMAAVEEVLNHHGISNHAIKGNADAAKHIEHFKKTRDPTKRRKVLMLNMSNEFAAGINVVNSNHVIFLSPLLAPTQDSYVAAMTQAIGRARRRGQEKTVHIYHFVALKTIDVDILEQRDRRNSPLCEDAPTPKKTSHQPNRQSKKESEELALERTKMIRGENGKMALVPMSWLSNPKKCAAKGIKLGEAKDFSSLITFSRTFRDDDDND